MSAALGPETPAVRHDIAASRFVAEVAGRAAVLDYARSDGVMAFTRTYVPPDLRGRGLAEVLVRAALAHARESRCRVRPDCSYVAAFVAKHPEFGDMVD